MGHTTWIVQLKDHTPKMGDDYEDVKDFVHELGGLVTSEMTHLKMFSFKSHDDSHVEKLKEVHGDKIHSIEKDSKVETK